jgi:hypothetical protein
VIRSLHGAGWEADDHQGNGPASATRRAFSYLAVATITRLVDPITTLAVKTAQTQHSCRQVQGSGQASCTAGPLRLHGWASQSATGKITSVPTRGWAVENPVSGVTDRPS